MKKYVLLLLTAVAVFSCSQENKHETLLSGMVENWPNGIITLVGSEYEKEIILNKDGSFTMELDLPYNGYYNVVFGRIPLSLYLEKGKNLAFQVDLQNLVESLKFSKDLASENTFLAEKQKMFRFDLRKFQAQSPEDVLIFLDDLKGNITIALEEADISNSEFLKSQENELLYQRASFLNKYSAAYHSFEQTSDVNLPKDFYRSIEDINESDTLAFRLSNNYQQMLQGFMNRKVDEMANEINTNETLLYIEVVNETLPAGYAKNQLLKKVTGNSLKADRYIDKVYKAYMDSQTDSKLKQTVADRYSKLSKLSPGNESPVFDYENIKGGTTSLESLKGKYVYVDVWATWCVPCLHEIPYLKEVERDYHDKNIVFVGISIDDKQDYRKWKNMVVKKELAGIQLYSGGDAWQAKFAKNYQVEGIPRFILIDPEGKIFDADTYRPSDNKLRKLLDKTL